VFGFDNSVYKIANYKKTLSFLCIPVYVGRFLPPHL
jgi:hypothetical protein